MMAGAVLAGEARRSRGGEGCASSGADEIDMLSTG